jgi:hypothetical protein
MKRLLLVLVIAACSSKKEEPKPEPKEEKGLFGKLEDKAKDMAEDVSKKAIEDKAKGLAGDLETKAKDLAGKAKDLAGEAGDKAKAVGGDLETKATELGDAAARKAAGLSSDAVSLGAKLKDEVRAVHIAKFDYDLAIDSGTESEREHADRLRGMKTVKVGDYSVGYEQVAKHPLGKVYNWQFRITWRLVTGQVAKLSLYTDEELPELELAALLTNLIPKADLLLKLK